MGHAREFFIVPVVTALAIAATGQISGRPTRSKVKTEAAQAQSAQQDANAAASVSGIDEQQLRQLEQQWADAVEKNDKDMVARIAAEQFHWTGPDGNERERKAYLSDVEQRGNHFTEVKPENVEVVVQGGQAVVTGVKEIRGQDAWGKSYDGKYHFTDKWVKRDGNWRVLSEQLTTE